MNTKIITRPIWLLSLVSLFADLASEMLYPIMPVYLSSIGFSIALIGLLEGMAEVTAGLKVVLVAYLTSGVSGCRSCGWVTALAPFPSQ